MNEHPFYYKSQVRAPLIWVLAFTILGCWLYAHRKSDSLKMAPREITLELKVIRPGMIGEVTTGPNQLIGKRIHYYLSKYKNKRQIRGELYQAKGILNTINKNNSEFERYLYSQHIDYKLNRISSYLKLKDAPTPYKFFDLCNAYFEKILSSADKNSQKLDLSESILVGMLLGNKQNISKTHKNKFKLTGSLHLFAISGLHVGVIAGVIAWLLKWIPTRSWIRALVGLSILFLYVEITGAAPSAMRAFYMIGFYWLGKGFNRQSSAFSALLGSAILALILDPLTLWHIGFQLSYCVVGSILLFGLPLCENFYLWLDNRYPGQIGIPQTIEHYCLRAIGTLLIFSLSAWLGSAPFSVQYFKLLTLSSVLLSIILIPLATGAIILGFISLLTGILQLGFISTFINWIALKFVTVMLWVIDLGSSFSYGYFNLEWKNTWVGVAFVVLLGAWMLIGHRRGLLGTKLFYTTPLLSVTAGVLGLGNFL